MQRIDSLEKTLMLGGIGGRRRRGPPRMRWLDSITDSMDINLRKFRELVMDREACVLLIMGSQRVGHYWVTELNNPKTVVCMCMCLEQEEMGLTSYYRPRFNLANYIIIKYHILSTNALSTVFKHFKLCSLPRLRHYHWNTFDLMNTRTVKLNMHVNILSNIISLSL